MTYIEFYDKNLAENICACLKTVPERVFLIGDDLKKLKAHSKNCEKVFEGRGKKVKYICKSVNKNNLQSIVFVLEKIIEKHPDCVFDLTGGQELYHVAVGIVCERYKHIPVEMHRINIKNGTLSDCNQDGCEIIHKDGMYLTVEENIRIYGGEIVYDNQKPEGTHIWDIDREFEKDVLAMWDICKTNPKLWNIQIGVLRTANSLGTTNGLTTSVSSEVIIPELKFTSGRAVVSDEIIDSLVDKGLIGNLHFDDGGFTVTYKSRQVKKCLTKEGQVLELLIYLAALKSKKRDGNPVYNDVMTGVAVDWDGTINSNTNTVDTENEIDVMMMHGLVPVFVSCKNGSVDTDELYKLNTVATRFGGDYAKKVLVTNSIDKRGSFADYFKTRAADMGISILDNVNELTFEQLKRAVGNFHN